MNSPATDVEFPANPETSAPAPVHKTRPLYWSLRRELWESRSIYFAPLSVAAILLLGFAVGTRKLPDATRAMLLMSPDAQRVLLEKPYAFCAFVIILTTAIVAVFYCLDALHGERRDRSILFWKSLPVSDVTTVLAKAMVPLVILPVITFAVIVVLQVILIVISAAVIAAHGLSTDPLWTIHVFQMPLLLLYSLVISALWYAPIYGWLLLVSAWARRGPFLWAVLPPLGIMVIEKLAFNTAYVAKLVGYRLTGNYTEGFVAGAAHGDVMDQLSQTDPMRFLTSIGLWTGLLATAALFATVIWFRRYREPI
jgi:ABC-2 type transport system permease protein